MLPAAFALAVAGSVPLAHAQPRRCALACVLPAASRCASDAPLAPAAHSCKPAGHHKNHPSTISRHTFAQSSTTPTNRHDQVQDNEASCRIRPVEDAKLLMRTCTLPFPEASQPQNAPAVASSAAQPSQLPSSATDSATQPGLPCCGDPSCPCC